MDSYPAARTSTRARCAKSRCDPVSPPAPRVSTGSSSYLPEGFFLSVDALLSPAPELRIVAPRGVYAPADDSRLLAESLTAELPMGQRVLDLCTGSGLLAATAARAGADVTAIDICPLAAEAARANLKRNQLPGEVICGDLIGAAPSGGFDVIVSNPPYVPAHRHKLPSSGPDRAWDAGNDGRTIIDRICTQAPALLRPGGRLLLIHSHVADISRTLDALEHAGLKTEVTARRTIAFGPVMHRRTDYLIQRGLIAPGQRHEEIAVVRSEAPADWPCPA